MSKLSQNFAKVLLKARAERTLIGNRSQISSWIKGRYSPSLDRVEQVLEDNEIILPHFYTGIDDLLQYVKEVADKEGYEISIVFEKGIY